MPKGHKIFSILIKLKSVEWKNFRKYVAAHHESKSHVVMLMEQLFSYKSKIDNEDLADKIKEDSFRKISQKEFSNLMSKLYLTLQDWIVSYDLINSKYDKELALVKSFNDRGIYQEADRVAKKLEYKISNENKLDLNKSRSLYLLKDFQYLSDNPIKYREGGALLQSLVDAFNTYYKEHTHMYNAEMYNWGRIKKMDFSPTIKSNSKILTHISDSSQSKITASLEAIMRNYNKSAIEFISDLLLNNKFEPGTNLHAISCGYAIAGCIKLIRDNTIQDYQQIAKLYNHGLETRVLLTEGNLPIVRFFNIISALASVTNYEEVDAFIEKWHSLVNTKSPTPLKHMAKAHNCLHQELYEDILVHTRFAIFKDSSQKLRTLRYELVALYEMHEFDLLQNHLKNYIRMIKRNKAKISNSIYQLNISFYKIIHHFYRNEIAAVEMIYHSKKAILFRSWIAKKLKR